MTDRELVDLAYSAFYSGELDPKSHFYKRVLEHMNASKKSVAICNHHPFDFCPNCDPGGPKEPFDIKAALSDCANILAEIERHHVTIGGSLRNVILKYKNIYQDEVTLAKILEDALSSEATRERNYGRVCMKIEKELFSTNSFEHMEDALNQMLSVFRVLADRGLTFQQLLDDHEKLTKVARIVDSLMSTVSE